MRIVLADDITGAAEVAALAWQAGLEVAVFAWPCAIGQIDLAVIDTNTRNIGPAEAISTLEQIIDQLGPSGVRWTFKKVDSVLRGNVVAELSVMLRRLPIQQVILAPANPSKGRVIRNGRYYINEVPLDMTDLARDPFHPRRSSLVMELLDHVPGVPVCIRDYNEYDGEQTGIILANVQDMQQLWNWARLLDDRSIAAGGSDFFGLVLDRQLRRGPTRSTDQDRLPSSPSLFVCGSTSGQSQSFRKRASDAGIPVHLVPADIPDTSIDHPAAKLIGAIRGYGAAILAIEDAPAKGTPVQLASRIAAIVQLVLCETNLAELFLEGGTTARAVMDLLGWRQLSIVGQYAPGLVRMALKGVDRPHIVVKPGSYPWPAQILPTIIEA